MDGEHLIVLLEAVLHKDDRIVAFTPAYGGQIFVGFMVPLHFVGDCPVAAVVAVVAEFQQGQPHVGIGGQRLRIAVACAGLVGFAGSDRCQIGSGDSS